MFVLKHSIHNPILIPNKYHPWEAMATFNWCPIKKDGIVYAVYRAMTLPSYYEGNTISLSTIGYASSKDGINFDDRRQFIKPEFEWEKYGCEDPRMTYFEGKYYIFYTALSSFPFGPENIKVALATSKDLKKIDSKNLITPFNAKAMALFPERINGKIAAILTVNTDRPPAQMAIAEFNNEDEISSKEYWEKWQSNLHDNLVDDPIRSMYDSVEVGAPPLKTPYGWLLVYSHIQNYFPNPQNFDKIFGIEVLLLDLNDPRKIIGRTKGPILAPIEPYEIVGIVPNITFPSGAYIEGDELMIYYGSADTSGSIARVRLSDLLGTIRTETTSEYHFKRYDKNPILKPNPSKPWESKAVFNPAAIYLDKKAHILYRAMSADNTSVIGYANSKDCLDIDERLDVPIYVPREEFEIAKIPGGNSGCEDPRIMKIGDRIYMCYTAFDGIGPPRVAITSISEKDFLNRNWNWQKPLPITPKTIDDKDTCILPQKIKGKYMVIHRIGNDICADFVDSLDFRKSQILKCIKMFGPRISMWDSEKVGISAPPIKTKNGWLLLYHGVSKTHKTYRIGAVLLDKKDPIVVLSRLTDPILEPETSYEKFGQVNNVVFPCGVVVKNKTIYAYYGGADSVVGVATIKLDKLLKALTFPLEKKF